MIHFTKSKTKNEIICTQGRVLMAVLSHTGSGKSELVFKILSGNISLYILTLCFFYLEMQQLYIKTEQKLVYLFEKYAYIEILNSIA